MKMSYLRILTSMLLLMTNLTNFIFIFKGFSYIEIALSG